MTLQLYNSLHNRKEPFTPMDPSRVTLYVCGPTVYNYVHIGNARPAVVFDTLARLLRLLFPGVVYARNITDIDDKINNAAFDAGEDIATYSQRFTRAYHEDMAALHNAPPDLEPFATDHIDTMINLIGQLIDRGCAYESGGHVLFDVTAMTDYGRLSKRQVEDMMAGARVDVADYKHHPMDFVLWKPSTEAHEPGWDSPWGYGRPGWHIECTAMIKKHLGNTIDIHGGGQDLMFPHHENEIAQGTCCHDHEEAYVRYWVHNGMINVDGEKMSKSLNNFITVRELLAAYPGEQLRCALLAAQYRSVLNWSDSLLRQSRDTLDRFYGTLRDTVHLPEVSLSQGELLASPVTRALCDDLNTPQALAELHQLTHRLHSGQESDDALATARAELLAGGRLLGLLNHTPEVWFQQIAGHSDSALSAADIEVLLTERADAKKAKNFARADEIRDHLTAQGVEIQDTREGTRWQWQ